MSHKVKIRALARVLLLPLVFCLLLSGAPLNAAESDGTKEFVFNDLTGHWAAADLQELAFMGFLKGDGAGSIRPDDKISRAEFTCLLVRALELSPSPSQKVPGDVSNSKWYYGEIQSAFAQGLAAGTPDGRFRPEQDISRAEAAAFLIRALNPEGGSTIEEDPVVKAESNSDSISQDKEEVDSSITNQEEADDNETSIGENQVSDKVENKSAGQVDTEDPRTTGNENLISDEVDNKGTDHAEADDKESTEDYSSIQPQAAVNHQPSSYSDVRDDFWAKNYIEQGKTLGLVSGFPDGTFKPNLETTRAQAAVMIYRLLQEFESDNQGADLVETVTESEKEIARAINNQDWTLGKAASYLTGFALARTKETAESIKNNLSQQGGSLSLTVEPGTGQLETMKGRLAQVSLSYQSRITSTGGGIETSQKLQNESTYKLLRVKEGWKIYYSQSEVTEKQ